MDRNHSKFDEERDRTSLLSTAIRFKRGDFVEYSRPKDGKTTVGRVSNFQRGQETNLVETYVLKTATGERVSAAAYRVSGSTEEKFRAYGSRKRRTSSIESVESLNGNAAGDYNRTKVHDAIADRSEHNARRMLLEAMSASALLDMCTALGVDSSACVDKDDFIAKIEESKTSEHLQHRPAGTTTTTTTTGEEEGGPTDVDIQALALVRSLIANGTLLLDDEQYVEAVAVFEKAVRQASGIDPTCEARALAGLASSYLGIDEMRVASAPLFETAASLFHDAGQTSDELSALVDAADAYARTGALDRAADSLAKHDDVAGDSIFESKIEALRLAHERGGLEERPGETPSTTTASSWGDWAAKQKARYYPTTAPE